MTELWEYLVAGVLLAGIIWYGGFMLLLTILGVGIIGVFLTATVYDFLYPYLHPTPE